MVSWRSRWLLHCVGLQSIATFWRFAELKAASSRAALVSSCMIFQFLNAYALQARHAGSDLEYAVL